MWCLDVIVHGLGGLGLSQYHQVNNQRAWAEVLGLGKG